MLFYPRVEMSNTEYGVNITIDDCLEESIKFHDVLHKFRALRGTGTATLEVKILQKIVGMQQEFLYDIFVDLQKDYGMLDRGRALVIMEGYGVGP